MASVQTSRALELLHIDLMGLARVQSLGGKKYILVVVDNFTRYTWVVLLKDKVEAPEKMIHLCKKLQVEKDAVIARIKSDHRREFENTKLATFCNDQGTHQEFSSPKTPQQNGIVEQKNRVVQEMARFMLHNKRLPKSFWREAVNTACHTLNRVYFRLDSKKTPYELWRGKKPVVKYFGIFGSDCYILRDIENLEKFDAKSDVGYFLGYSSTSRAYRVYNLRTKTVMESSNVVINDEVCSEAQSEHIAPVQDKPVKNDDSLPIDYVGKHSDEELMVLNDAVSVPSSSEPSTPVHETQQALHEFSPSPEQKGTSTSLVKGPSSRIRLNHPSSNILGSLNDNMRLRSKALSVITHSCYLSQFDPKKVDEALQDAD